MSINVLLQRPRYFIQNIFTHRPHLHNHFLPSLSKVSLLSDYDIKRLIDQQLLIIDPYDPSSINSSSIDLRLGSTLVKYFPQTIKIGSGRPEAREIDITNSSYVLRPGEFILGTTEERISVPDGYQGIIETKGNIARAGILIRKSKIMIHNNDAHIDPGFCGHITLEIKNMNEDDVFIELIPGSPICQLFIAELSSTCDFPYNGKYLNQEKPTVYCP